MTTYTDAARWRYRCSICKEVVHPDDVAAHTDKERDGEFWPGVMSWERVDPPFPDEEPAP